jgi:hypothetical protein
MKTLPVKVQKFSKTCAGFDEKILLEVVQDMRVKQILCVCRIYYNSPAVHYLNMMIFVSNEIKYLHP